MFEDFLGISGVMWERGLVWSCFKFSLVVRVFRNLEVKVGVSS